MHVQDEEHLPGQWHRLYPGVRVEAGEINTAGLAGAGLLTETIRAAGLGLGLSRVLDRWRKPGAVHGPGKVICDLALSLALGGKCVPDLALLACPEVRMFGPVASPPRSAGWSRI